MSLSHSHRQQKIVNKGQNIKQTRIGQIYEKHMIDVKKETFFKRFSNQIVYIHTVDI